MRFTLFAASVLCCVAQMFSAGQIVVKQDFDVISLDEEYVKKAKDAIDKAAVLFSTYSPQKKPDENNPSQLAFNVDTQSSVGIVSLLLSQSQAQQIVDFYNKEEPTVSEKKGTYIRITRSEKPGAQASYSTFSIKDQKIINDPRDNIKSTDLNLYGKEQIGKWLKGLFRQDGYFPSEYIKILGVTVDKIDQYRADKVTLAQDSDPSNKYTLDYIHLKLIRELANKGSPGSEKYAYIKSDKGRTLMLKLWKNEIFESGRKRTSLMVSCVGSYDKGLVENISPMQKVPSGKYQLDIISESAKQYIKSYFYPDRIVSSKKEVRCELTENIAAKILVAQNIAKSSGSPAQLMVSATGVGKDAATEYIIHIKCESEQLSVVNVTSGRSAPASQITSTQNFDMIFVDNKYAEIVQNAIDAVSRLLQGYSPRKDWEKKELAFTVPAQGSKKAAISCTISALQAQRILDFRAGIEPTISKKDDETKYPPNIMWITTSESTSKFSSNPNDIAYEPTDRAQINLNNLDLRRDFCLNEWLSYLLDIAQIMPGDFLDRLGIIGGSVDKETAIKDGKLTFTRDSDPKEKYTLDYIHLKLIRELAEKGGAGNDQYAFLKEDNRTLLMKLFSINADKEIKQEIKKGVMTVIMCEESYDKSLLDTAIAIPRAKRGPTTYEFDILGEPGRQYIRSYFYPGNFTRVITAGQTTLEVRCDLTEEIAGQILILQHKAQNSITAQLMLDATGVGKDAATKYKIYVKYDNTATAPLSIVNVTKEFLKT